MYVVISWHRNRFIYIYIIKKHFVQQAPIGAEEVEILRVVGEFPELYHITIDGGGFWYLNSSRDT